MVTGAFACAAPTNAPNGQIARSRRLPARQNGSDTPFAAVDKDNNNRLSEKEWTGFEQEHAADGTPPKF